MFHPKDHQEGTYISTLPLELLEELEQFLCTYTVHVEAHWNRVTLRAGDAYINFMRNTITKQRLIEFIELIHTLWRQNRDEQSRVIEIFPSIWLGYKRGRLEQYAQHGFEIYTLCSIVVHRTLLDAMRHASSMLE